MKFLFKYPTRGRPAWFKKTLDTYYFMLSGKHDYEFVISLDEDDVLMNNQAMIDFMKSKPNLDFHFGLHSSKIEAVNDDMVGRVFDILFLISDDMIPKKNNFDDIIASDMKKYFPDMDGALHYDDGCCGRDQTITLSIMGSKLYEKLGYIYHPDYKSFYCDNEFTDVVRKMGKYIYLPTVLVKHEWGGWGSGDAIYKRNTTLGKGDEQVYRRRKENGFLR